MGYSTPLSLTSQKWEIQRLCSGGGGHGTSRTRLRDCPQKKKKLWFSSKDFFSSSLKRFSIFPEVLEMRKKNN
jgi:hypothetical protein